MLGAADHDPVLVTRYQATLILTLNTPGKRNVLDPAMYQALRHHLAAALADPAIANIILTGADGFFCAGGDLVTLREWAQRTVAENAAQIEGFHTLIREVRAAGKPVIAAIEGGAAGAGASLAMAAHLIVAAEDSYMVLSYVRAGLVPDGGATGYLRRAVPPQFAAEMALFGDQVPVARLATLGVVNRVVPKGQALAVAQELADRLAAGARGAQRVILGLLNAGGDAAFDAQLDRERDALAQAMRAPDAVAGIAAFLDKRPPVFPNPEE